MKYVILIHSKPRPWGRPTSDYVIEDKALSAAEKRRGDLEADFESVVQEMSEAAASCSSAAPPWATRPTRGSSAGTHGRRKITDGPYAETVEQFTSFSSSK